MALYAAVGQMKTRIVVKQLTEGCDADGFPTQVWTDPFGAPIWCQWHNNEGNNKDDDGQIVLTENAALTIRFTRLIDVRCRIWLADDPQDDEHAWEVRSVNNADMKNHYMDVKVRRVVVA